MIQDGRAMFTVMDSIAKYLIAFYPCPIVWRATLHLLFVVMILGPA